MSKRQKAVVSVSNDLYTDQRVDKICRFLLKRGYDVLLIGRKRRNSLPMPQRPYQTKRMRLPFEKGPLFYACLNVRLFFALLFQKADLFVSNDLDTLPANYLASKFKRKVRLVYDSHEYFTEVPELQSRPLVRKIWLKIEQAIFPRLKSVYTVNESIAAKYRERYGVDVKVVRNISPRIDLNSIRTKTELGIPENRLIIIMQGAGININRGAEEAVEAMKLIDAVLLFVGDGDVMPLLKDRVKSLHLEEKVLFFGKRPWRELMEYTFHADIGLSLDKPNNDNYRFSLPNKIFDYMQAGTAILCSQVQEVERLVKQYDLGIVLDEVSPDNISKAINQLVEDRSRLQYYQSQCRKAAEMEHWDNECLILEQIYPSNE